jgi:putative transposase
MMSDDKFDEWLKTHRFSLMACEVIRQIRKSPPSRLTRSTPGGNVSGRYPSKKMGLTIQFESHRIELPAICAKEYNPDVLEYYDQPPPFLITYPGSNGRKITHYYTADFFTIWKDRAVWEEWKPEEKLRKISEEYPGRYYKDDSGKWRCPPGEAYAATYGLYFEVHSSWEINENYQRNINFLEDYLRNADKLVVPEEIREKILIRVRSEHGITLAALLDSAAPDFVDAVYTLIIQQAIYVDLNEAPLVYPDKVKLFIDASVAHALLVIPATIDNSPSVPLHAVALKPNARIVWDQVPWEIVNYGFEEVSLKNDEKGLVAIKNGMFEELVKTGKIIGMAPQMDVDTVRIKIWKIVSGAGPLELAEANRRSEIVIRALRGEIATSLQVPERTLRSWKHAYNEAQQIYGYGYFGLLPNHRKGNREPKTPFAVIEKLKEFKEKDYLTVQGKTKATVYRKLKTYLEDVGVQSVSYKKWWKYIEEVPKSVQLERREGSRAAYNYKIEHWVLEYDTPVHGDRPFEVAHIDHTEVIVELRSSQTNANLGKAWLTLMIDAYPRRILAVHLSFEPPSYRSCMMVMRECVRRFGRLPQYIVHDGGPEFGSIYFQTLQAAFEVTSKRRPKEQSRYGSVIERIFNTTEEMFFTNLMGNTKIMKNVRKVTQAVNPKNLAVWTLPDLYKELAEFAYETYDTKPHSTLGNISPRDFFNNRMAITGQRVFKLISYDDIFKFLTLPSPRPEKGKVVPGKGIKIRNIYYWNNIFNNPDIENSSIYRRYDPYNVGSAYAYAKDTWVKCLSEYNHLFEGMTETELKLLSDELRRDLGQPKKVTDITARKLAEFMNRVEEKEKFMLQRLKSLDNKKVLDIINNNEKAEAEKPVDNNQSEPQSDNRKEVDIDNADIPIYGAIEL